MRLSKLERSILAATVNLIVNTCDDVTLGRVAYRRVFKAVSDRWFEGVPAMAGESRANVAKASFSRAVQRLIAKGLLGGTALAWCDVSTCEHLGWQGGGRSGYRNGYAEGRPRLKLLYPTEAGRDASGEAVGAAGGSPRFGSSSG